MRVVPRIMRQPEAFLDPQNAPKLFGMGWGFAQDPTGGVYSAPPDLLEEEEEAFILCKINKAE